MNLNRTSRHHPATRLGVRVAAVTLLLIGGFALKGHPVSAATQNGVATHRRARRRHRGSGRERVRRCVHGRVAGPGCMLG